MTDYNTIAKYILDGDLERVQKMIRENPNIIHLSDSLTHTTIFMYAICCFNNITYDFIKFMIDHGANVNDKNECDVTPLHFCMGIKRDYNILKLLLYHGANIHAKTIINYSVFSYINVWRNYKASEIYKIHLFDLRQISIMNLVIASCKKRNKLIEILQIIGWNIEKYLLYDNDKNPTINLYTHYEKRKQYFHML